jgi:hypothetical protein
MISSTQPLLVCCTPCPRCQQHEIKHPKPVNPYPELHQVETGSIEVCVVSKMPVTKEQPANLALTGPPAATRQVQQQPLSPAVLPPVCATCTQVMSADGKVTGVDAEPITQRPAQK